MTRASVGCVSAAAIDPRTRLGAVRLRVRDLDAMASFYERVIGLRELRRSHDAVVLGVVDGAPLVELLHRPGAGPRPTGTTGLFHLALLVPDRAELAAAIRRVTDAGWSFTGASDHLVSEAVYLRDPEGNGIELYRDRTPDEWDWDAGAVRMATLPLDVPAVMAELPDAADVGMSPQTVLGHVHLNVADLASTEAFYNGALGFDVTTRGYPGALFLAAGGYHHHIGSNVWEGAGAPSPPPGALGLDAFEVVMADADVRDAALERAIAAGLETVEDERGTALTDPSGNRLILRAG
jgi:catechol 2,3-dioxygenase